METCKTKNPFHVCILIYFCFVIHVPLLISVLPLGGFFFFLSIYVSAVKCNVQNISLHFVPASSQSTIVSEGFKGGTRGDPLVIVFNCVQNICYSLLNSSWGKITLAYAVVIDYYMR